MKKIITLFLLLILASFQQPKTYTLTFTDTQLEQLYSALSQSQAPFIIVSQLQAEITKQYRAQADTTKKK